MDPSRTEPTLVTSTSTSTSTQQFSAQIAHTMVKMMSADTASGEGTASAYFHAWHLNGGSAVASKTGTDNDDPNGPDGGTGNTALLFVRVTPHLVAAAALVDPAHPKQTVSGLPVGVLDPGSDVFGAYESTFWLDVYGPTLAAHPWSWPFPSITPATPIPTATPAERPTSPATASASATPSPCAVKSPPAASPSDVSSSPDRNRAEESPGRDCTGMPHPCFEDREGQTSSPCAIRSSAAMRSSRGAGVSNNRRMPPSWCWSGSSMHIAAVAWLVRASGEGPSHRMCRPRRRTMKVAAHSPNSQMTIAVAARMTPRMSGVREARASWCTSIRGTPPSGCTRYSKP